MPVNHEVRGNGTICYISTDGGYFGIVGDDGSHYIPLTVDPLSRVDGLRVTYRAMERFDRTGVPSWGIPVDLIELTHSGIIEQKINGNGTVRCVSHENATFGISADSGTRYLPVTMNETYMTDGLRVNFSLYPAPVFKENKWGSSVRIIQMVPTGEPMIPLIVMKGHIRWISTSTENVFGIMGEDGILYVPEEMPEEFHRNGLYVSFTAEKIPAAAGHAGTRGLPVRLYDIEAVRAFS